MSAENHENKRKSENVFLNAFGILISGIIVTLAVFYFFPDIIIRIFAGEGKVIPEAISILFYLGIAFSFMSLANLILLYKLSVGKFRGYFFLLIFILIEILLLCWFSASLFQFSIALIASSAAFLWGSIVLMNE